MKITKKINNNVAFGIDGNGQNIIVYGKGVGFKQMPYELTDMSVVTRTYYDLSENNLAMLKEIPDDVLAISSEIVDLANNQLANDFNDNLIVTLADHINFAIQRINDNSDFYAPISFDIKNLYPKEYQLAQIAIEMINGRFGIELPKSEAVSITLHLINAETQINDMHQTLLMTEVTNGVAEILKEELNFKVNPDDYHWNRFLTHLRFLVLRQIKGSEYHSDNNELYGVVKLKYPKVAAVVEKICKRFTNDYGWVYNDEEKLYLIIHINKLIS